MKSPRSASPLINKDELVHAIGKLGKVRHDRGCQDHAQEHREQQSRSAEDIGFAETRHQHQCGANANEDEKDAEDVMVGRQVEHGDQSSKAI